MITTLFWLSLGTIFYVYFGYPIVLFLLGIVLPGKTVKKDEIHPSVTLIISVYNEEATLHAKLQNTLALDYPREQLEVLVVSDASSDQSDEIAKSYENQGIKLLRQARRGGKTLGLNKALQHASGDIVLFSDANAMYQPDLVKKIVRNFADSKVGYVTGESRYKTSETSSVSVMENLYWTYEIAMKKLESRLGSMVGADGAVYAIRKDLYEPLQSTDINDFVNPLQIIAKGYRGIYEPEAICYEETASSFRGEFRRRVRIVSRSWRGLFRVSELLNPFRYGAFSIALISHKLLRWLIPFAMTAAFISNILLYQESMLYQAVLAGQLLFLSLALIGGLFSILNWHVKLALAPYYICLANLASLLGVLKALRGKTQVVWEPERATESKGGAGLGISWISLFLSSGMMIAIGWVLFQSPLLAEFSFWVSGLLIVAVYAGYPLSLGLFSKLFRRKIDKADIFPTVSLLVAAYNEEDVIEEKIKNALALNYPKEKLEILIGSDGSTDRTNEIIRRYAHEGVRLLAYTPRQGKVSVLNRSIPQIQSEITVLSDANTMYDPGSIKKLVRNFADASVGVVSGDVILKSDYLYFGKSEGVYYRYERYLQEMETQNGCMVGVDGAMYAIRTPLFQPPSNNIILDDFVISMNIAREGHRIVFEPEALAYETGSLSTLDEFKRKIRVIAGAIQALKQREGLPKIWRQPCLTFQYVLHKLLRWTIPLDLLLVFMANLVLLDNPIYQTLFFIQVFFYLLAILGTFSNIEAKGLVALPFYFCMVNLAALLGIIKGFANLQSVTWDKLERR